MFVMKSFEEELKIQKAKLETLSNMDGGFSKSKEIVKQLQDQNKMLLEGIEQYRLDAIKFNKEHGLDYKHLER